MASKRVGIFGGTFSPFHMGHLNCAITIAGELNLDELKIIPAHLSPNRPPLEGPTAAERFEMVQVSIAPYAPTLVADDREIHRGGVSYTLDTIQDILSNEPTAQLFLVLGGDQFESFDHWRGFEKIIERVNIVVVSRPGCEFPKDLEGFPPGLRNFVESFDGEMAILSTSTEIQFFPLQDIDISGSEIRSRLRAGEPLDGLVPEAVATLISERGWYHDIHTRISDYRSFTQAVGKILNEKNAIDVVGFDLGANHYPAEFALVASGSNTRQTGAIAEYIMNQVREKFGVWPQNVDGKSEGRWVILDYGALMVHIYYDYVRHEYRLEEMWADKNRLNIEDPHAAFRQKSTVQTSS